MLAYIGGMALPNLVRSSEVARLLGVHGRTVVRWTRKLGLEYARAPVRGVPGASPAGRVAPNCVIYLSMPEALRLVDAMLPGIANRLERGRLHRVLSARATYYRAGAARVVHDVQPGRGTGSEAPRPESALHPFPQFCVTIVT